MPESSAASEAEVRPRPPVLQPEQPSGAPLRAAPHASLFMQVSVGLPVRAVGSNGFYKMYSVETLAEHGFAANITSAA